MAGPGWQVLVDVHAFLELAGYLAMAGQTGFGWNLSYLDLAMFRLGWLSMTGWSYTWLEMAAHG